MSLYPIALYIAKFDPPTVADMAACSEILIQHPENKEFWFASLHAHPLLMTKLAIRQLFPETPCIKAIDISSYGATLSDITWKLKQTYPQMCFHIFLKESDALFTPTKEATYIKEDGQNHSLELKKRLKCVKRDSSYDVCKVISLAPKLVLEYIIVNKLYLNE